MHRSKLFAACVAITVPALALSGCGVLGIGQAPADLQIYSARHYDLEGAFADFTEETGISVEFITGDDAELLERLKAEGSEGPADVFMTVDAGNLWNAARQDVLAPVSSATLEKAVPEDLRDPEGQWFGLAMRARTLTYNPDNVDPAEFDAQDSYAGLADPKWKGRLCMRDATSSYTQSLVASLIDLHGRDKALEIVKGWVANDVEIMSNDILLLEAIDAGACDVGINNHYYLARTLVEKPDLAVDLFWASQEGAGAHVNISGAGVVANSDNAAEAQQLIEWLATTGQNAFVDANHEFPVNPSVEPEPVIAGFGEFSRMPLNAKAYGDLNAEATELLAEAGYK
ncbi:family 1 extracellular solute-binding protein [Arthrobacter crystallopoietes BAB-32]|uniref:Family 1 extracellular solute-binding protein n=1 Tax=Arthrobacter crystallopoietes BAB-32 TaxID=1246476 RepID=N1UYC9_9MICC|nr:extracellular solute-binding protein [Arthrobacter crystallopoietes]EMY35381.1 family 1 extracellular solute-binding protein [Arthrobacter crystallopoietes BAB-32]